MEILVAMLFFIYGMKRRRHFPIRGLCCLFAYASVILFLPNAVSLYPLESAADSIWLVYVYPMAWCIIIWAILVLLFWICFDENIYWILFCGVAAYCVEHSSYSVYCIMEGLFLADLGYNVLWLQHIIMLACYVIFFFILRRWLKKDHEAPANKKVFLVLCVFALFIMVCLSIGITYYARNEFEVLFRLYGLCSALLLLALLFTILNKDKYVRENYALRHMWQSDMKHYEAQQQEMELINIKIHDLRHGFTAETEGGMDKLLAYYDASFKTGNEALNVVLTEKNYACIKQGIRFTCLADGTFFNFMDDNDIYSLFGNILDNAIEAVMQVPEEKREISVTVTKKNDILSIMEMNYFNGKIEVENGEIVTAKRDRVYHGFGLKSIKFVADKYGGTVMVNPDGDMYCINVMFFT